MNITPHYSPLFLLLVTVLSCALDHSPNALALAQALLRCKSARRPHKSAYMVAERRCAQPMQGGLGDETESLERDLADSKRCVGSRKGAADSTAEQDLARGQEELRDEVPGNAR